MSGKSERVDCMCKEWAEGIRQIGAQAVFCSNQAAGPRYTAATFRFCPWCGKVLDPIQHLADALGDMPGSPEDWGVLIDEPYG